MRKPGLCWKPNRDETQGRLIEWWNGRGLTIGS